MGWGVVEAVDALLRGGLCGWLAWAFAGERNYGGAFAAEQTLADAEF